MRSFFWHILVTLGAIAVIIILFFIFSVDVQDKITYTDEETITAPEITIADPTRGEKDADITVVAYGDYECPACANVDAVLNTLGEEGTYSLRLVWKDMPNASAHPEAVNAAIAARCAGEQKKFWEYHDALMENRATLGNDLYLSLADDFGLKSGAFERCLSNQETLPLVERGYEEGLALRITATPTLYINGERYSGGLTLSELTRAFDALKTGM